MINAIKSNNSRFSSAIVRFEIIQINDPEPSIVEYFAQRKYAMSAWENVGAGELETVSVDAYDDPSYITVNIINRTAEVMFL